MGIFTQSKVNERINITLLILLNYLYTVQLAYIGFRR